MDLLEISLLGPPAITFKGRYLNSFESDKVRALLYYLTVESEKPVRREHLAGLLWPDQPEKRARHSLSQALYNLRQVIADRSANPPFLLVEYTSIQLNTQAATLLDTAVFDSLVNTDHQTDNIANFEKAISLYRGDFLAGFSLPDAAPFEEWALWQRERFHRQMVTAHQQLSQMFELQGAFEQALHHAQKVVALLPWLEEMQQAAMRLLALNNRRNEALAQYEACRQTLAAEFGVEPMPQTQAVYEAIRSGQISRQNGAATLSHRAPPSSKAIRQHNLPQQTISFVGRADELAALHHYVEKQSTRLITIVGAGGMGKTQLAIACARKYALNEDWLDKLFPDGVWLVNLMPLSEVDAIIPTMAKSLQFQLLGKDDRSPRQQILDYLQLKKMLLVFDNFEHLLSGATLLSDILQIASGVQILVTSRERLNLKSEQVYPLEGLDFPETGEYAAQFSAVQFFCQCAQRRNPEFVLQASEERDILVQICQIVAGMPLAIELASTWVDTLSLTDIAIEMTRSLDFLTSERRDMPDRHHSMRAVFQSSWERLAVYEQEVFAQLSIFRGGFTRKSAVIVTNCSPSMLAGLVSKSFLQYDQVENRYQIHELMRQFGADKLAQNIELAAAVQTAHSHYYCTLLQERTNDWHTGAQLDALATVTQESDNVEQACRVALQYKKWSLLLLALDSLMNFYEWHGRFHNARSFCQEITQKIEIFAAENTRASSDAIRLWSKALAWLGHFAHDQEITLSCVKKSLKLLEHPELAQQDTRVEKAFALLIQAICLETLEPLKAQQLCQQSYHIYEELGDKWGEARNLEELATMAYFRGEINLAADQAATALTIQEKLGDLRSKASLMNILAWTQGALGYLGEAEQLHLFSLSQYERIGDQYAISIMQAILSNTLTWNGKILEAESLARQGLINAQSVGHRLYESYAYYVLGATFLHQGHYQLAAKHAGLALELVVEYGNWYSNSLAHVLLGQLALVSGDYLQARAEFVQGISVSKVSMQRRLGVLQAMLSIAEIRLNHISTARNILLDALSVALDNRQYKVIVHVLAAAILLFVEVGAVRQAIKLWATVSKDLLVRNSRWFQEEIGRYVEKSAVSLELETVQLVRGQGLQLSVWEMAENLLDEMRALSLE